MKNLRSLSKSALKNYFPGMDPHDVAVAIEQHQKHSEPSKLATYCRGLLLTMCSQEELHDLLLKKCRPDYNTPDVDFDTYLEKLVSKCKVSVTVSKLNQEMIQLWTKTHLTNLDPYSELE